jgi:hypothetical protein
MRMALNWQIVVILFFLPKTFISPWIEKYCVILIFLPFFFYYMYNEKTNAHLIDRFLLYCSLLYRSYKNQRQYFIAVCINTFM